jgi:murein DD-endopeptidase MepM/ murein hydrolase activator NlpD
VIAAAILGVKHVDLTGISLTEATAARNADPISVALSLPLPGSPAESSEPAGQIAREEATDQVVIPRHPKANPMVEPAIEKPAPIALAKAAPVAATPIDDTQAQPSLLARPKSEAPPNAAKSLAPQTKNSPAPVGAQPVDVQVTANPLPTPDWVEYKVQKGDSLARIFSEKGLDAALLHRIVNSSDAGAKLADIRPGQTFRFRFDDEKELSRLELHRNRVESIRVTVDDVNVRAEEISKDVDTRIASAAGTIESSLFVDGQKAGLADGQIMELAEIFGWDIDFALEIRAGDNFRVLYEEQYLDGEKLRNGPILAAEFTNRGTTHTAIRYEDSEGEIGYFDADGNSKRRAFIRTPIKFARISSRYNPRRWHPVLKQWRSHKGVDYAAPTGTPIKATGDGKVVFRGTKGGYGRTVMIEHAGKYTTLYAHMSKYSKRARQGSRVKQGQVIGYVGKSGLATGPHLHYEFRVNGVHKDPLKVKLPESMSLPKNEIASFKKAAAPLLAKLESVAVDTMVASIEPAKTN